MPRLLTETDLMQATLLRRLLPDRGYNHHYANTVGRIRDAWCRERFGLVLVGKPYTARRCRRAIERALGIMPTLILLFGLCPTLQAQEGEATRLLDRADTWARYQSTEAWRQLLERAARMVDTTADRKLAARLATAWGEFHYQQVQDDSARLYYNEARRYYAAISPSPTKELLELDATLARMQGQDARALDLSLQAVEACTARNDSACLALALWEAGSAFFNQHQFAQATDYSDRALNVMARQLDTLTFVNYLDNYANTARLSGRPAVAAEVFARARALLGRKRPPRLMSLLDLDEGILHMEEGDTTRALRLFEEGLAYAKTAGANLTAALIVGNLGTLALIQGDYDTAIARFREELRLASHVDDPWYTYDFKRLLGEAFAAQGRYDSAYYYLNGAYTSFEEQVTDDYERQLSELQVRFETSEKEARITLQQQQLTNQRGLLYAVGGGLALALMGGILLTVLLGKLRRRNTVNQRLVAEKETLIGEIHHRVKNNLQVISSLLQLQSRGLDRSDTRAHGALRDSQSRVQAMGLIHQKLYQDTDAPGIFLPNYLRDLGDTLLDAYRLDDQVEISYDVAEVTLDVDTSIPLGLIVNELVTNALKYAFPKGRYGTIDITVKEIGGRLRLSVADDGIGQSGTISGTGFGTRLVDMLSRQLRAMVDIPTRSRGYATHLTFTPPDAATS